jgi:hypothetical protein
MLEIVSWVQARGPDVGFLTKKVRAVLNLEA